MRYKFTAAKAAESDDEEYESALICSSESVQSILNDYGILIDVQAPSIYISLSADATQHSLPFSLDEARRLLKQSFMDADGKLYPEFSRVDSEIVPSP